MPIDLQALARAGATVRLAELQQEISGLQAAFPELNGSSAQKRRGRPAKKAAAEIPPPLKRKEMSPVKKAVTAAVTEIAVAAPEPTTDKPAAKRTMSAEGRARISAAQKKRWAKAKRGKKR
jgi:hypothetical protein